MERIISPKVSRFDKMRLFRVSWIRAQLDDEIGRRDNDFTAVILDATAKAHARQARAY